MGYRVEGAGAFGFSLNWVKVAGDDEVARRVIIMLEDRRLLFGPRHAEDEMECVRSAEQIRRELTRELAEARPGASLASSLRAIRAACRRFMEAAGPGARYFHHRRPWEPDPMAAALGELRSLVGLHVAAIAGEYSLEVEDGLSRILPPVVDADDDPAWLPGFDERP